jgi:hypothetical protein
VSAFVFLLTTWPVINRADGTLAERLATREDPTRVSSTALLIGASLASLIGVGFALRLAGHESGASQTVLVGLAVVTVALSSASGQHGLHPALRPSALLVDPRGHRLRQLGQPGTAQLPRLSVRGLHHRDVLPSLRHHCPHSPDQADRAHSCDHVLPLRRDHCRGIGKPNLWPDPLRTLVGMAVRIRPQTALLTRPTTTRGSFRATQIETIPAPGKNGWSFRRLPASLWAKCSGAALRACGHPGLVRPLVGWSRAAWSIRLVALRAGARAVRGRQRPRWAHLARDVLCEVTQVA